MPSYSSSRPSAPIIAPFQRTGERTQDTLTMYGVCLSISISHSHRDTIVFTLFTLYIERMPIMPSDGYINIYTIVKCSTVDIRPAYRKMERSKGLKFLKKNIAIDLYSPSFNVPDQHWASISTLASSNFDFVAPNCTVVFWVGNAASCAEVDVSAFVPKWDCTMTMLENSPRDTNDSSGSNVCLYNTRYANVTITRRLQTMRLTAAYFPLEWGLDATGNTTTRPCLPWHVRR